MGSPVHLLRIGQGALLLGATAAAVALSSAEDWEPLSLFALLLAYSVLGEAFRLNFKNFTLSGTFLGLVLAMTLLGPAPAAAIAVLSRLSIAIGERADWSRTLVNVSTFAAFPVVGGLLFELFDGPALVESKDAVFLLLLLAVFLLTNLLNFLIIAVDVAVIDGQGIGTSLRRVFLPVLPLEVAIGVLAAAVGFAYAYFGLAAVGVLVVIGLVVQYLVQTALSAAERGEQLQERTQELEERNEELASLQVGLISTMLKTLSLRDRMTARHSAAVARYSREVASALGVSEREQELIHTAALFHDIGKFIFPDSILLADRKLTDDEYALVKRHPEVGAELIAEIDGYGPVAEIVRYHHERFDGRGYPEGISGTEIPLGARIIAVADVYDVITARDTYRKPVALEEALAELRRCAGTQFDPLIVEAFIRVIETQGVRFRHSTHADFEAELALRTRVRDYAAPRIAA